MARAKRRSADNPENARAQQIAEEQLINLVESDRFLQSIMKRRNATREAVRALYVQLGTHGADRLVRGHWVAASALVFGSSLDFLLARTQNGADMDEFIWTDAASRISRFFRHGGGIRI
jgi:hypothetical protein